VLRSSVPLQQVNKLEITPDKQYLAAAGNPHIRLFDVNSSHPHPVCILSVWFPVLYSSSAHMELLLLLCIYMCKPCWDLTAIDISNNTVYNPNTPRVFWAAILKHYHDPQLWTLNPILLCGSTTLWYAMLSLCFTCTLFSYEKQSTVSNANVLSLCFTCFTLFRNEKLCLQVCVVLYASALLWPILWVSC
jgi:hypothetical protein